MSDLASKLLSMMFSLGPSAGVSEQPSEAYNTPMPDELRGQFERWVAEESERQGRDLLLDIGDYDIQGYWLAGERPDERGHGTDRYKKPNHPTFSNESIYHGVDGNYGGSWGDGSFTPGRANLEFRSPEELAEYFRSVEPGVKLMPSTLIPR